MSDSGPSAAAASAQPSSSSTDANAAPAQNNAGQSKGKAPATEGGEQKLSAKDLKLKQKAEKQARRAQEKAARGEPAGGAPNGAAAAAKQGPARPGNANAGPRQGASGAAATGSAGSGQRGPAHRRTGSVSQAQRPMPIRQNAPAAMPVPKKKTNEVGLFGHLYGQPRRQTIEGASKEVHPAVLALGFQMSNYVVTGSSARCVAMLLAFKAAIAAYTTPPTTSLARHLTSHYLSPQIEYLKSHRPISVSMGNAIRWLKDYIIQIDPDVPENIAKADITDAIDTFIRERITVADTAIASTASAKIRSGSHVVTYAKSSIVEQTLLAAAQEGVAFSVTVLDSRPLFEGRNLAAALSKAGVKCTYALLPAAPHVLATADLVLLGAHAMMANGRLYSRAGTASVAMLAKTKDVPVIVCCESLKFTDRVSLDSVVLNEVAPSEELVTPGDAGLQGWADVPNLQLLNIMYDVTPAQYVDMVITEYGSLPPSSVPVVHRISTERDVRA